jgi:exopolysaccharide biosynthesis WecB/TagA/CpsF family protein
VNVASAQTERVIDAGSEVRWPPQRLLFGVPVSVTTYEEAERAVVAAARARRPALVDALAVHVLAEAVWRPEVGRAVKAFELVTPDGQPVRWALNILYGAGLGERVYGPELMRRLCARAAADGIPIYLYGSTVEVLRDLCSSLLERFPGLRIAGAASPPFRPLTPAEDQEAVARINASGAEIVFIGLGAPKQEVFAAQHRERIRAVQVCVGAAFDFLAGTKPMAPVWMQAHGLEWLFRVWTEPRRLWRRYLISNSWFVGRVSVELLRHLTRRRARGTHEMNGEDS